MKELLYFLSTYMLFWIGSQGMESLIKCCLEKGESMYLITYISELEL
ncbi:hypothetical protein SAMN05661099_1562 [Daejeonella lutea]|uniref:Uncharacterized protein n=1 Tax=Daejeonella lutea TaxID=572036 RepID=A0A1T5BGS2_9SPHI|nr:hypothetical protein SAMN05661099_1562 [Daejeonella lutea]